MNNLNQLCKCLPTDSKKNHNHKQIVKPDQSYLLFIHKHIGLNKHKGPIYRWMWVLQDNNKN